MKPSDFFQSVTVNGTSYTTVDIMQLEKKGLAEIGRLPFSIRILVENLLRKLDGRVVTEADVREIAGWRKKYDIPPEIPFHPARVLMQDLTGVPAVVDLAAMRDAIEALGGDPKKINPLVPVDLIVDHSVQVDFFGTADAMTKNVAKEYERNGERYTLLKWAQKNFANFRVVPPSSGICHQVNLENIGSGILAETEGKRPLAYPDTLVGTDSHTPMINGIGVLGWGVGGIEAEAVMLGQPYYMSIPSVVGVRLSGRLGEGVTATDLVLRVTEMLRSHGVVEKFVEYFGPGIQNLTVPDRATISNMTPEYGATVGFFPIDGKTIEYLHMTNRSEQADITEACARSLGLFYSERDTPEYSEVLELDLGSVEPSVAGPARPQDRIELKDLKSRFAAITGREPAEKSCATAVGDDVPELCDGNVVIAAITSCTNTSNPSVMLGAGLVARNAVEKGLKVPPFVKTSLAPGSKVVVDYLQSAGLMPALEALGFHLAGFGCTTCIGNSGPLPPDIDKAVKENDLTVAAVLSGNRNFEARIHQRVRANFLASPMLVVAFALAGRIDIDLSSEPLGNDPSGQPVFLKDIWPESAEIQSLAARHVKARFFEAQYGRIFDGDRFWRELPTAEGVTYQWDPSSTYIKKPPYFDGFTRDLNAPEDIRSAAVLMLLGDTVTTDHISPAGAIPRDYPAGRYLIDAGVAPEAFNSYGSRRGNHEVMTRGTFGNIRIKNKLVSPREGSRTLKFPEKKEMFVYDAAMAYQGEDKPLVVLGGKEYGTGSSRDWAAKGSQLLGVRAVIAESFERIHRSNLVGMGVLPLVFEAGDSWQRLGLDGSELFTIAGLGGIKPRIKLKVTAEKPDGSKIDFNVTARLDTDVDVDYFLNGGILPYVLRKIISGGQ